MTTPTGHLTTFLATHMMLSIGIVEGGITWDHLYGTFRREGTQFPLLGKWWSGGATQRECRCTAPQGWPPNLPKWWPCGDRHADLPQESRESAKVAPLAIC